MTTAGRGRRRRAALMPRAALTPRQQDALDAIVRLGRPRVRDLAAALGITSPAVRGHLEALRARGFVTWEPRYARTLRVVGPFAVEGGHVTPLDPVPVAMRPPV